MKYKHSIIRCILMALLLCTPKLLATTVQVQTNLGQFDIILFDTDAPNTVENFLSYVRDGSYDNVFINRLVPNFVMQAGGFTYNGTMFSEVTSKGNIDNEEMFSNIRGTIAMAKINGNPNSATSEWFINLVDNSANLDYANGGFTVFGKISDESLQIIDNIAALNIARIDNFFTSVPLQDINNRVLDSNNLVLIESMLVTNTGMPFDTSMQKIIVPTPTPDPNSGNGGGGGSLLLIKLFMLGLFRFGRKFFYICH